MKFGITFFPAVGPDDQSADKYFDDALDLAVYADERGFYHVKTVEHYFFPYGGYSPDPVPFLSAVAARTRSIRIATGAVIPAFSHPIQLAGRLAVLDNLSHGRLDVGFGRAFLPDEFAAFGIILDESRARFDDGVRIVERLWTEEDVVEDGPFHRFGPVTLLPRPYQRPGPPVFVATATSPASAEQAGLHGRGLQAVPAIAGPEGFTEILAAYRRGWESGGRPSGTENVQVSLGAFVANDRDEAHKLGRLDEQLYSDKIAQATKSWATKRSTDYPGYENLAHVGALLHFDKRVRDDHILVGTVDDVRRQLARLGESYGTDITVSLTIHSGNLPAEVAERTLDYFADKIAPEFAD
ncbi:LLM class flavin-dependent oxidoreductase [Rhodococcus jostii]|uniref:LLM class flavin-dependent oxidoreductase n=1 Tax=Rhodococcus jostii TaxID=132919 RepID=A0ABU4CTB6_RHOJO|nr:LLM class flavin-dependent oxidoreductase [Rhodococcus jostii]MDV6286784.1 LLM class flavin-dependent oxidoreductase [Rhodococcus jostii]